MSAKKQKKPFNINEFVWVKLNDKGVEELKRQHDEFRSLYPNAVRDFVEPKKDEDGYSKFQMHNLMSSFGHMMILGVELPFEATVMLEV